MRGTIRPRTARDGSSRFDAIWRDSTGAQRSKTFASRRAAERFLSGQISDRDADAAGLPARVDGAAWLDAFAADLEHRVARGTLKPSTAASYRSVLRRHIRPAFAAHRTDRITHRDVSTWTARLAADLKHGRISPKTHNNVIALWSALITWSRHPARRYITADLAAPLERATRDRRERAYLEPAAIARLIAHAADGPARRALILAVYAGLRRGEIVTLQAGDVDHEHRRIHVRRAMSAGRIAAPKTGTSRRTVDVPGIVLETLEHTRTAPPGSWVFPAAQDAETPMHADRLAEIVEPAFEAAGVAVRLHGLRHTYASLLINAGESPKYVSEQLGHASTQITLDLYSHLFRQTRAAAMQRLEATIASSATPPAPPSIELEKPERESDRRNGAEPSDAARMPFRVIAGGRR